VGDVRTLFLVADVDEQLVLKEALSPTQTSHTLKSVRWGIAVNGGTGFRMQSGAKAHPFLECLSNLKPSVAKLVAAKGVESDKELRNHREGARAQARRLRGTRVFTVFS
jgi:hypothetical protein